MSTMTAISVNQWLRIRKASRDLLASNPPRSADPEVEARRAAKRERIQQLRFELKAAIKRGEVVPKRPGARNPPRLNTRDLAIIETGIDPDEDGWGAVDDSLDGDEE